MIIESSYSVRLWSVINDGLHGLLNFGKFHSECRFAGFA